MKTLRGSFVAATVGLMLLLSALPVAAADAVVYTHVAFSNEANQPSFWEDFEGGDYTCDDYDGDVEEQGSIEISGAWDLVIVKAGSGENANTVFKNVADGSTVWADTNGDGIKNPGGRDGDKDISHIIVCNEVPAPTPTPTPTPTATPPGPTPTPTDNVDTGGGNEPPKTRATVPPTDTVENTEVVVDPARNPLLFLGIFLIAVAVIGTILQARKARNDRETRSQ